VGHKIVKQQLILNKMKKINLLIIGLAFLGLTACEKETTANKSRVTNYPLIDVSGPGTVFVPEGGSFTDPGVTATENGAEIPVVTEAMGVYRGGATLDLTKADLYEVTYRATNADGFDGTAGRTVWVYKTGDLITSMEGLYTCTVVRNGSTGPQYTDMEYVLIWKNTDGTYEMSCGIGAYYEHGRGYGPGYRSSGAKITATSIPGNVYSITDFSNDGFGGDCTMTDLVVDPVTKTISYTTEWSFGYTFKAVLTQVEL
jgi:hypothetical protein